MKRFSEQLEEEVDAETAAAMRGAEDEVSAREQAILYVHPVCHLFVDFNYLLNLSACVHTSIHRYTLEYETKLCMFSNNLDGVFMWQCTES